MIENRLVLNLKHKENMYKERNRIYKLTLVLFEMKLLIMLLTTKIVTAVTRVQVKSPLTVGNTSAFAMISELIGPSQFLGTPNIFETVPSKKLKLKKKLKHASPKDLVDFVRYGFASTCVTEELGEFQCFCSNALSDQKIVEASPFGSLAIVGLDKKRKKLVVSYRHTFSSHSKDINGQYQMTYMPGAPRDVGVHYGLLSSQLSLQNSLEETVSKYFEDPSLDDFELLVTGYSSGGSVAVLALPAWCEFLKREKQDNRKFQVISYANSRVGNSAFADYVRSFDVPLTRYTLYNDIIPRIPARAFGFTHVGVEIHERQLGNKSALEICDSDYDEDPNCSLGEPVPLNPLIHFYPFGKSPVTDLGCDYFKIPNLDPFLSNVHK